MTTESFPRLFYDYYAIHETIHGILAEDGARQLDVDEIARRVREKHRDLTMGQHKLAAAIRQAIRDTEVGVTFSWATPAAPRSSSNRTECI